MKSRDSRKPRVLLTSEADDTSRRGWSIFGLLELVPEFQNDIKTLRRKYDIPDHGFRTDDERTSIAYENYDRKAEVEADKRAHKKLEELGDFFPPMLPDTKRPQKKQFQIDIESLGDRFRLPYYFYNSSIHGLAWYALRNRVMVLEKNWDIVIDPIDTRRNVRVRFAMIRAHQPLNKKEAAEAIAVLNSTLQEHQPCGITKQHRVIEDLEKNRGRIARILENRRGGLDWIPKSKADRALLTRANRQTLEWFGYRIYPER